MAAGRGKFTIPAMEDLEDEKPALKGKSLFQTLRNRSSENVGQKVGTETAQERIKAADSNPTTSKQTAVKNVSHVSSHDGRPLTREKRNKVDCVASSSSGRSQASEKVQVGKNFSETFAFLKETSHYVDASARISEMKEKLKNKEKSATEASVLSKAKPNAIIVNPRQKGNPILKHVRNVPWEFGDIVPDYVLGSTTCALFLSLRYHHFNPGYIHERLRDLGQRFELRVLLVQVDVKDPYQTLQELAKMAIMADCTLILAWSPEEAGRYLETYKVYENKPADALQGYTEGDHFSKLTDCLTTLKGINKTDVVTLNSTFGNLAGMAAASKQDLSLLPGFGPLKAQRLHDLFREPFIAINKRKAEEMLDKNE